MCNNICTRIDKNMIAKNSQPAPKKLRGGGANMIFFHVFPYQVPILQRIQMAQDLDLDLLQAVRLHLRTLISVPLVEVDQQHAPLPLQV